MSEGGTARDAPIFLTLAIGTGATTLMFSLVDAALIRPLLFADSGRLVLSARREAARFPRSHIEPHTAPRSQ